MRQVTLDEEHLRKLVAHFVCESSHMRDRRLNDKMTS